DFRSGSLSGYPSLRRGRVARPEASREGRPPPAPPVRRGETSEITAQVQSRIQAGYLIGVAVERKGRAHPQCANAALSRLAPARVVDFRIHVRIETVLPRCCQIPGRARLVRVKMDPDDRLPSLEAILPGNHQPKRRTILWQKRATIDPRRHEGEGMHRFIHS